ncbi:MAG: ribonuclease HII [Acidobacteria bacterium]|nr:ribonuclease HII [Acidobacteriota bacterium]
MAEPTEFGLFEQYNTIIGVDEAGRGCLAGPVYICAVLCPRSRFTELQNLQNLTDSKKLSPKQRDRVLDELLDMGISYRVSVVNHRIIDDINILQASLLGMKRSVARLALATGSSPIVVVDGNQPIETVYPQITVVKGDLKFKTIAAASIFAKVLRDRFMIAVAGKWPQYGFESHKGYPSPVHKAALREFGPCPIHRLTFRPCRPK